jgi:four helix bundle protein
MTNQRKYDIKERSLAFAVRTAKLIDSFPRKITLLEYSKQLARACASIGANLEEADGALSKKDFLNKIGIARKEAKETRYWLQLIKQISTNNPADLDPLIKESEEIKLILSSIINNTKANS